MRKQPLFAPSGNLRVSSFCVYSVSAACGIPRSAGKCERITRSFPQRPRRPRTRRVWVFGRDSQSPSYLTNSTPSWASSSDLAGASSFLQCVECHAVYAVDSEELEGEPRIVRCCACLHEWYASELDLIWGDRDAAAAIETDRIVNKQKSERVKKGIYIDEDQRDARKHSLGSAANDIKGAEGMDMQSTDSISPGVIGETPSPQPSASSGIGDTSSTLAEQPCAEEMQALSENMLSGEDQMEKSTGCTSTSRVGDQDGSDQMSMKRESQNRLNDVLENDASRQASPSEAIGQPRQNPEKSCSTSAVSNSIDGNDTASRPSSYNIFVGNLSFRATEKDLYRAFSGYGHVIRCQIPFDSIGCSRGYGFVEMSTEEEGSKAVGHLQGASILGREVNLCKARARKTKGGYFSRENDSQNTSTGRRRYPKSESFTRKETSMPGPNIDDDKESAFSSVRFGFRNPRQSVPEGRLERGFPANDRRIHRRFRSKFRRDDGDRDARDYRFRRRPTS